MSKRCKDCKWWFNFLWIIQGCNHENNWVPGFTCYETKVCYVRKWSLWWAWWIPKMLLITLALVLGGCSQHVVTLPDGTTYKANRFLDSTKIGSVSYDEGSFTLDGYESDLTKALGIIDRLIAREEVGP